MARRIAIGLIVLVTLAFLAGQFVRGELNFEFSAPAIHSWVEALGWKGPVLYLCLFTFRQFLLLPSMILLTAGGLCFGAVGGTALGSAGIMLSGAMKFSIARGVRRGWDQKNMGARMRALTSRIDRAGPLVVGFVTAHPIGPMTPVHWAAGLSTIPIGAFLLAIAIGGIIRAGSYSFLGSAFDASDGAEFYAISGTLIAVASISLAHPGLRRRVLAPRDEDPEPGP